MKSGSNFDAIVLDMEDALIDKSLSMCTAVSRAVDAYLVNLIGVNPEGGPLYSPMEINNFAQVYGFDDEHELLSAMLMAAMDTLSVEFHEDDFEALEGSDLLESVRKTGKVKDSLRDLGKRKNLHEFAKTMRFRQGSRKDLERSRGIKNRWLVLSEGHIMMDNFVKRVFAESYLGEELFQRLYGCPRKLVKQEGAIGLEKLWIDEEMLGNIRKRCPIGVITKRTQAEAQFLLEKTGAGKYIDAVIGEASTNENLNDESSWIRALGVQESEEANYAVKVTEVVERLRWQEGLETLQRVAYVGNCIPEARGLVALKDRFRITLIGCVFGQDKKSLAQQKEHGADFVAATQDQLYKLIVEKPKIKSPEYPMSF